MSPRVQRELPVTVRLGGQERDLKTVEISLGGAFVATDEAYQLNQLVQLSLELPQGPVLEIDGMIVRTVEPDIAAELGIQPGVAVQFYGLDGASEDIWHHFIEGCFREATESFLDCDDLDEDGRTTLVEDVSSFGTSDEPALDSDDAPAEDVARAAGLDPRIVAAALASDVRQDVDPDTIIDDGEEQAPRPCPTNGDRTVIGSPPPRQPAGRSSQRDSAHLLSPIATVIHIIGPDTPQPQPAAAPAEEESSAQVEEPSDEQDGRVTFFDGIPGAEEEAAEVTTEDEPSSPNLDDEAPTTEREPVRRASRPLPADRPVAPDQAIVPVASGAIAARAPAELTAPLAPTGLMPNAVYRLELSSTEALEQFSQNALRAGGVFIRTSELRRVGLPAVVCVVHPDSFDEFHIPGVISSVAPERPGVSVRFAGIAKEAMRDFRRFIALGTSERHVPSDSGSLSMIRGDSGRSKAIPTDTQPINLSEIEPYRRR